jgi:hypothetical protein
MKALNIILGIIVVGFFTVQIYAMRTQSNIETYPYKVVKQYDKFEVRNYEASLFTSVKMATNQYEDASRQGFSMLAGYIFGGNDTKEKIAMTSPVAMSLEDSMTMMFMVPRSMSLDNLPKPNEAKIEFRQEPPKTVASISFGGWATDKKIAKYKSELIRALKEQGIKYTSNFFFLGYNAPFEVFNRRNEIIVELTPETIQILGFNQMN